VAVTTVRASRLEQKFYRMEKVHMIERGLGRLFSYDLSSTGDDPDRTAPVGERTPHQPALIDKNILLRG
tara:strand:- start:2317 stop:2523 length:207 start_codon:yes stop_codon:yes gene_type:complete